MPSSSNRRRTANACEMRPNWPDSPIPRDGTLLASDSLTKHDRRIFADVKATVSPDGLLNVVYRHAIGHGFGRIHALGKRGYSGLTKVCRKAISPNFYVEDDIVNTFPTLLNQIFIRLGQPSPLLAAYVEDREQLFKDIADHSLPRDEVKRLFLVSLHLGDYLYHTKGFVIQFLTRLQAELKRSARVLAESPAYASLYDLAKTEEKSNPLATLVSWVCQIEERKIMQAKTALHGAVLQSCHRPFRRPA